MIAVIDGFSPTGMRGREDERRTVLDLLERVARGGGGMMLAEGEPGIGKSVLLRTAVDEAATRGSSLAALRQGDTAAATQQMAGHAQGMPDDAQRKTSASITPRRADRGRAVRLLAEANQGCESIGARADTARVCSRLRHLGVRRRHWTQSPGRPFHLRQTFRELDIGSRVELARIVVERN